MGCRGWVLSYVSNKNVKGRQTPFTMTKGKCYYYTVKDTTLFNKIQFFFFNYHNSFIGRFTTTLHLV